MERDSKRFNILNKIINDAGAGEAVMTINENFLDIVNDDFKESLDYIVLDPTCSGSGTHGNNARGRFGLNLRFVVSRPYRQSRRGLGRVSHRQLSLDPVQTSGPRADFLSDGEEGRLLHVLRA